VNDSPGWTAPGSPSPDRSPDGQEHPQAPDGTRQPAPGSEPPPKWSAQQPPPQRNAGWGPPPPPSPGPSGWNHRHEYWNQPPAAKPGIVPLRPLGVGEILDGAVAAMRAHWRTVLGISLAVAVVVQSVATVVNGLWLAESGGLDALTRDPQPSPEELTTAMTGTLKVSGTQALIEVLGTVLVTAMLTVVVSRAVLGRAVPAGEAWRDSRPQLLRLLGLLFLLPLLVFVTVFAGSLPGAVVMGLGLQPLGVSLFILGLLAGLVAAVWLWVRFSLAATALMLEKQGVVTAMRRSAKLVRGSWWRVFGVQLVASLLVALIASVIQLPATVVGLVLSGQGVDALAEGGALNSWPYLIAVGVGAVIASTVAFPIRAGVTVLLYLDQRIRREALDLELARAAGVPGYDPRPDTSAGS
jgi:hypothetical protein